MAKGQELSSQNTVTRFSERHVWRRRDIALGCIFFLVCCEVESMILASVHSGSFGLKF